MRRSEALRSVRSAGAPGAARPEHPRVLPERTEDPVEAANFLRRDGTCLLAWSGAEKADLVRAGRAVLGDDLLAEWEPRTLRPNPQPGRPKRNVRAERLILEATLLDESGSIATATGPLAEGWGLGDGRPEYLAFLCAQAPLSGGESYLIRSDLLLASSGPPAGALPGGGSLLAETLDGRWVVSYEAPAAPPGCDSGLGEERAAVVDRWHAAVAEAARLAPRFPIVRGDVLFVDNYRAFQGREPYRGGRVVFRAWLWTSNALSFPMLGDQATPVEE